MNIIQNIVNMYKTDPINFLLTIAVIYLLLEQSDTIENFKLSNVEGEINLAAVSIASQLPPKWKKAFEIDNEGNITLKKKVNILPRGTILAWTQATAPPGWALCDGQNGTPDLRGRFIRMKNNHGGNTNEPEKYQEAHLHTARRNRQKAGVARNNPKTWMLKHALNDKGGSDIVEMIAGEMPSHKHETNPINKWLRSFEGAGGPEHTLVSAGGGLWINDTKNIGGNEGHNNMPPYYVLSYIMKL